MSLARTYAAALLLHHGAWSADHEGKQAVARIAAARRWCRRRLVDLNSDNSSSLEETAALALT